jgi:cell division transport system permease protein
MSVLFSFQRAASSILHEKWINLLSVLTIAAGILITALTLLSVYNIDIATKRLPENISVMLYLKDNLSQDDIKNIANTAENDSSVEKVKYISKDTAMKELKANLKNTEYVLDGLDENPLPDSLEIKLKSDAIGPENVKKLTAKLTKINGVQEVEYGEKFLSSVYSLRTGVKTVGMAFIIIMSAGMVFVCYSTVKILFYRKSREIETYKLLGATKSFIRAPFFIEGAVIGFLGGLLALFGMLSLYYLIILKLGLMFPIFSTIIFPINMSFILPLAGFLLGITGAGIAIGRIRY